MNPENSIPKAPRSFWQPIEDAHGDVAEFKKHLLTMSRDELIEMYKTYKEMALELFSEEHLEYLEDNEDEINDTASWVVTQGEAYYLDVYNNPRKTPSDADLNQTFMDEIVGVFSERFQEWISVASAKVK